MRVIAGQFRGRILVAPEGRTTRPILDRVKVALFDWLGSRLAMPGLIPTVDVLDIFCGGGSLGIESLSRGARHCTFVEQDRIALSCLRENISKLNMDGITTILPMPAQLLSSTSASGEGFALVFLDPPYRLSEDMSKGSAIDQILNRLGKEVRLASDAILIWRHDRAYTPPTPLPGSWKCDERRTWGTMAISLLQKINS